MKTIAEAALENWQKDFGKGNTGHFLFRQSIERFIDGAEFAQRWIPFSESTPPLSTELLVKNAEGRIATALFDDSMFWVDYKAIKSSEVTHWRPITLK